MIFPRLSVRDNLAMGAYKRNDRKGIRQDIDRISLFPRLKERAKQYGGTLSGGEQQMLAIGRALMARPLSAAARRTLNGSSARFGRANF